MNILIVLAALSATPDYTLCACDYQIAPVKKVVAVAKSTKTVLVKKPKIETNVGSCEDGQCGNPAQPVRIFRRWR